MLGVISKQKKENDMYRICRSIRQKLFSFCFVFVVAVNK
jgi:hypothetical protein